MEKVQISFLLLLILLNYSVGLKPPGYVEQPKEPDENPPNYQFEYKVYSDLDHGEQGHEEIREGIHSKGNYFVNVPEEHSKTDVQYITDDWGYHPVVRYSHSDDHSHVAGHFALGYEAVQQLKGNPPNDYKFHLPDPTSAFPSEQIRKTEVKNYKTLLKNFHAETGPGNDHYVSTAAPEVHVSSTLAHHPSPAPTHTPIVHFEKPSFTHHQSTHTVHLPITHHVHHSQPEHHHHSSVHSYKQSGSDDDTSFEHGIAKLVENTHNFVTNEDVININDAVAEKYVQPKEYVYVSSSTPAPEHEHHHEINVNHVYHQPAEQHHFVTPIVVNEHGNNGDAGEQHSQHEQNVHFVHHEPEHFGFGGHKSSSGHRFSSHYNHNEFINHGQSTGSTVKPSTISHGLLNVGHSVASSTPASVHYGTEHGIVSSTVAPIGHSSSFGIDDDFNERHYHHTSLHGHDNYEEVPQSTISSTTETIGTNSYKSGKEYSVTSRPVIASEFLAPVQAAVSLSNSNQYSHGGHHYESSVEEQNERPAQTLVEIQKSINLKNVVVDNQGHYYEQEQAQLKKQPLQFGHFSHNNQASFKLPTYQKEIHAHQYHGAHAEQNQFQSGRDYLPPATPVYQKLQLVTEKPVSTVHQVHKVVQVSTPAPVILHHSTPVVHSSTAAPVQKYEFHQTQQYYIPPPPPQQPVQYKYPVPVGIPVLVPMQQHQQYSVANQQSVKLTKVPSNPAYPIGKLELFAPVSQVQYAHQSQATNVKQNTVNRQYLPPVAPVQQTHKVVQQQQQQQQQQQKTIVQNVNQLGHDNNNYEFTKTSYFPIGHSPVKPKLEYGTPGFDEAASARHQIYANRFDYQQQVKNDYYGPVPLKDDYWGTGAETQKHKTQRFPKGLRIEYGFKPPLIPSTQIDEYGNPIKVEKP